MAYLEIKNLRKSFGDNEVLKGIDLTLEKGQVLAIIGASGGGKTTLLRCVNFLTLADEGSITVDGKEISGNVLPVFSDGKVHIAEITLG